MRMNRMLALGASMLVLIGACSTGGGPAAHRRPRPPRHRPPRRPRPRTASPSSAGVKAPIKIGSDDFYESDLMAEMYAQVLEKAGYKVDRKLRLGARQARQPALESGQVDLVPEYVGSGLGYYDKTKTTGDGRERRRPCRRSSRARAAASPSSPSPRPGHERVRRPQGHRRHSSSWRR